MKLNEEQILAATHPLGEAALLLAGAGSGKTATLTERIAWLIEQGIPSRKILALTFTNKAAGEIRERVLQRTGLAFEEAPSLTTIHSLALRFIRRNPGGFGLDTKVTPLADYDQGEMLKKIIDRMGEDGHDLKFLGVRDKIAFHRARGIPFTADYTDAARDAVKKAYSGYNALSDAEFEVWKTFEKEKVANSTIDFDDMLAFVNRRMRSDPEWAGKVQTIFQHILMDEAQDTNIPAWEFVNHLVSPSHRNLYVVGDLSQSIFGFIGAAPYLVQEFSQSWRGAPPALYKLQRNHRSVPQVVTLANRIQGQMRDTIPLTMESFRGMQGESGATRVMRKKNPYDLADRIALEIKNLGRSYKDYAILVRAASQVREIEGALISQRIPYVVRGGKGLLQTEEARDVLSYIRLATNPKDFTALVRAAGAPSRGLGDVALEKIRNVAIASHGGDLVAASLAMGGKMFSFGDTMRMIQKYAETPVVALEKVLTYTGYKDFLKKKYAKDPDKVQTKIENLQRLSEMVLGLTEGGMTVEDMIFQLTMDRTDETDELGAVTISTMHSAKGLEWPVVFVFNVVEGMLPSKFCQTPAEIEEERRLWYVAVTRARDICYISVAAMVQLGKNLVPAEPSRFLGELGIEV